MIFFRNTSEIIVVFDKDGFWCLYITHHALYSSFSPGLLSPVRLSLRLFELTKPWSVYLSCYCQSYQLLSAKMFLKEQTECVVWLTVSRVIGDRGKACVIKGGDSSVPTANDDKSESQIRRFADSYTVINGIFISIRCSEHVKFKLFIICLKWRAPDGYSFGIMSFF